MPTWAKVFLVPAILVAIWILGNTIGHALIVFIASTVIALVLNPVVRGLRRLHVPRGIAVSIVFLSMIAGVVGAAFLVISPVRGQIEDIRQNLPEYTDQAERQVQSLQRFLDRRGVHVNLQQKATGVIDSIQGRASELADNALNVGLNVLSGIVTVILVIVASIYMLLDAPRIARFAERFGSGGGAALLRRTERTLSEYVKAQLLVSAIIGVSAGLVLWVYGVSGIFPQGANYAVAFAAWVFVTEFIPYLGPILGAVPPIILALFTSPIAALWVVVAFIAVQQLEGHIVVPKIMGSAVGVHPLVVIFGLLVGQNLYGLAGVLLAIPTIVIVKEAVVFFVDRLENPQPAAAWSPTEVGADPVQGPETPGVPESAGTTREIPTVLGDPSPR